MATAMDEGDSYRILIGFQAKCSQWVANNCERTYPVIEQICTY